jgi:hypothetical protein
MIYYQYEVSEQGIIIGIVTSNEPFQVRMITQALALKIKCGKTKEVDIPKL